jgi:hypothetical protein
MLFLFFFSYYLKGLCIDYRCDDGTFHVSISDIDPVDVVLDVAWDTRAFSFSQLIVYLVEDPSEILGTG